MAGIFFDVLIVLAVLALTIIFLYFLIVIVPTLDIPYNLGSTEKGKRVFRFKGETSYHF